MGRFTHTPTTEKGRRKKIFKNTGVYQEILYLGMIFPDTLPGEAMETVRGATVGRNTHTPTPDRKKWSSRRRESLRKYNP